MTVVRRIYTPRPGKGGKLLRILKEAQAATVEGGFPPVALSRRVFGPHGTIVSIQRWPSIAEYERSRADFCQTESITQFFARAFPLLAATHETELYEEID